MEVINYLSSYHLNLSSTSRTLVMNHVLDQEILADAFIEVIYSVDTKQKIVLYHALDMLVEHHVNYLNNYLDLYLEKALNETHESIKRCVSRTIYHQLKNNRNIYNSEQKRMITQTMFDRIILTSAVATRVNSIHILYFLNL